jgi:hypothetical protein
MTLPSVPLLWEEEVLANDGGTDTETIFSKCLFNLS